MTSEDGGHSWRIIASDVPALNSIGLVSGKPTWAAGSGKLYLSTDDGTTWRLAATPCQDSGVSAYSFIAASVGWVICIGPGTSTVTAIGYMDKQLFKTNDGGLHWTLIATTTTDGRLTDGLLPPGYLGDLYFLDESHGWYSEVRHGTLHATSDGGRSWQRLPGLGGVAVVGVHFISPEFGSVLNMDAGPFRLMTTSDGGRTWVQRYP